MSALLAPPSGMKIPTAVPSLGACNEERAHLRSLAEWKNSDLIGFEAEPSVAPT
jgi:hypothetical protein